ncbi:MAG: NADH-quinone oxidoreductase subunit NuoN [Actinomycetes bacterium]
MSVLAASVTTFTPPEIDWAALAPALVVLGAAVVGVLVEAFAPRRGRRTLQLVIALLALVGALVVVGLRWNTVGQNLVGVSALFDHRIGLFLTATLLALGIVAVLTIAERGEGGDPFAPQAAAVPGSSYEDAARRAGLEVTEVFPLTLFALGGMIVFATAADLLTMFVALEVFSLPLYVLAALARRRRLLSQEASIKYFLLGAFSSGLFIYGVALIYGTTGTVSLPGMLQRMTQGGATELLATPDGQPSLMLLVGIVLVLSGLLFKIGAVPFHSWTPDVYTGAPTPVTGFMAACTKVAAFGALLHLLFYALPITVLEDSWGLVIAVVAVATMVVGGVVAVVQTDIERMLAYSSIAHAGFILTAMATSTDGEARALSVTGVLFYLVAYGFVTIGAFAVVSLVRERDSDDNITGEATHLAQWAGLGQRSPVLAGVFTLFLLAMAGIPLTSGFTGKYAVFLAAVQGGYAWLAVIGVLVSVVTAFFYVRVIVLMYFSSPPATPTAVTLPSPLMGAAIAIGAAVTVVLGVLPSPVLDLAASTLALP